MSDLARRIHEATFAGDVPDSDAGMETASILPNGPMCMVYNAQHLNQMLADCRTGRSMRQAATILLRKEAALILTKAQPVLPPSQHGVLA